jgi:D-methionine transport system ATP-binding protein
LAVYASGAAAQIEAAITHLQSSGVVVQVVQVKD